MPSIADIRALHDLPVPELLFRAASVHRAHWNPGEIQFCTLDSIKTGGCPEDCAYCPQSARYATGVKAEPLKERERVLAAARAAKAGGSTRYCMGAAWREVREGEGFEQVLALVAGVAAVMLPNMASAWPTMYLVAAWMEMSTPLVKGWKVSTPQVLSSTNSASWAWAA